MKGQVVTMQNYTVEPNGPSVLSFGPLLDIILYRVYNICFWIERLSSFGVSYILINLHHPRRRKNHHFLERLEKTTHSMR